MGTSSDHMTVVTQCVLSLKGHRYMTNMAISLSHGQLSDLLADLGHDDRSVHIRGEIRGKLNHVVGDFDFIVDAWPNYKALVLTVPKSTAKYYGHLGPIVSVHTTDRQTLTSLLVQPGVINWSIDIIFVCVTKDTTEAVCDAVRQIGVSFDLEVFHMMTITKDALKVRPVPDGFTLSILKPEQANFVNSLWKYNRESSVIYIRDLIGKLPSCCLRNADGDLVGYAITYHYGSVGMLHVMQQYRGKGYAKVIMSQLVQQCLEQEMEVYVLIEEENEVSMKLHQDIGFKKIQDSERLAIVVKHNFKE